MSSRPNLSKRPSSNDRGVSPPPTKKKQQCTTTNKVVSNFFTPTSKKEPEKMVWRIVRDSLLVGRYSVADLKKSGLGNRRIAAFDFDSTLISTISGKHFARDAADWKWWHSSVPEALRKLNEDGYTIIIISNQGGLKLPSPNGPASKTIKSDTKRLTDWKQKVSAVLTSLDLPISVYAATTRDVYRKPRTGMWTEMLEDFDLEGDEAVDLEGSFFVGDAGGRTGKEGKDHSCCDRDLASNLSLPFHTPEEYFLKETPRPFVRDFDPVAYLAERLTLLLDALAPMGTFTKTSPLDIILFVGSPGAGKSSFYWKTLQPLGYARVNQDILKTREKCLKQARALVEEGTSVVVDNTNADPETRSSWTDLAKKLNVPIRCVLFTASAKLCEHNDAVRALNLGPESNPENRTMLPKMAFTGFASRYREPKLKEGFADIVKVDFEFKGSEQHKQQWSRFWV
ncbi:PNK3P-domain-containing protein [Amniculicola lignicola CBS 123094]|uniref:PNK3P-domain-containing protein n=1 Tax=Amniculicola lignicola CBS 123094 TaxID=1392246 RepID=A0A6A5WL90_9PLEO|nr:PNK3P-domain-containing protein [Amniculicola lignicola CBS 123094]